jgi:ATP-binding cassette subfamily B protein
MTVVQVFNSEEREMQNLIASIRDHRTANIRASGINSLLFSCSRNYFCDGFGIALLVWAKSVIRRNATLGTIYFLHHVHQLMFRPISNAADKFNTLQMGMVASDRVCQIA